MIAPEPHQSFAQRGRGFEADKETRRHLAQIGLARLHQEGSERVPVFRLTRLLLLHELGDEIAGGRKRREARQVFAARKLVQQPGFGIVARLGDFAGLGAEAKAVRCNRTFERHRDLRAFCRAIRW
jgi:hypothetical protein